MFSVEFSDRALKSLKKLDRFTATLITAWIKKNLEGCADPRQLGKPLVASRSESAVYGLQTTADCRLL